MKHENPYSPPDHAEIPVAKVVLDAEESPKSPWWLRAGMVAIGLMIAAMAVALVFASFQVMSWLSIALALGLAIAGGRLVWAGITDRPTSVAGFFPTASPPRRKPPF